MARLIAPLLLLVGLGVLGVFGQRSQEFDFSPRVACAYALASLDRPAPDVLFIGASRIGRGVDPGYIQTRLETENGAQLRVERISIQRPNIVQYRPVIKRLLEERGAPKLVYLQVMYNFRANRQRYWDMPINPDANVVYASVAELADIQFSAKPNPRPGALGHHFEAYHHSFAALLLSKWETNIYAALRAPLKTLRGKQFTCKGRDLRIQTNSVYLHNTVHDDLAFTAPTQAQQAEYRAARAAFLPMDMRAPWRQFEYDQMQALISQLEAAGSQVVLTQLPAFEEHGFTTQYLSEIAQAFPDQPFMHPSELYEGPLGAQLAVSYSDSHHATPYLALHFSRVFADDIARRLN